MSLRRFQRGFLLNPFRFAGTTQSGAMSATGAESALTMSGAGVASCAVSSIAEADLIMVNGQATSGAMSVIAESVVTMVGAGLAATSVSVGAEAVATFNSEANARTCDAADFDGTNDWLRKSSNMTGAASSDSGLLSFWVYVEGTGDQAIIDCQRSGLFAPFRLYLFGGTSWILQITDSATGTAFLSATLTAISRNAWHHCLVAWDISATTLEFYIDGTDSAGAASKSGNFDLDFNNCTAWDVGSINNGSNKMDGRMAELYFAPGQFLDITQTANREKFRTSGGKPADLGSTGSTPTGTAPLIYLRLDDGETANNFAVNRGTGGNFTVNGTLDTAASSPSD